MVGSAIPMQQHPRTTLGTRLGQSHEKTHTAQNALVFLRPWLFSQQYSFRSRVFSILSSALHCSGRCFVVSLTDILGFCSYSAIAVRIAMAVLGKESRCVSLPHPYAAWRAHSVVTEDIHLSQVMSPSTIQWLAEIY